MENAFTITIIALATLYAFLPLWQRITGEVVERNLVPAERERWLRQKAEAYAAIKEAEFDQQTDKLTDADFTYLRDKFTKKAIDAIAALDEESTPVATAGRKARKLAFCPACGTAVPNKARFCAGCGHTLHTIAA